MTIKLGYFCELKCVVISEVPDFQCGPGSVRFGYAHGTVRAVPVFSADDFCGGFCDAYCIASAEGFCTFLLITCLCLNA